MSVFRCKMCGGTLEVRPGETTGVCEYCGTRQTIPRLDDERRANLYDRAGQFRRNNDYDKASDLYEQILLEDRSDAEAYWSLVLCRYGVEYVEDPKTHKRLPTVNRAQFASVFTDPDYRNAIKYADADQKAIYEAEAAAIEEIQKGILTISQKEKPFDVFICYKETDANGRRTPDSVLGAELYHELTKEGFKVFFSRITLEDKLGTAYEPYIFAALNSAKVMVVIGTRAEYFNAVWVKNEWSRYLALIRGGAKKTLIPAYRDMDPYDLPEEFAHLQAQDMSKLGFMQDLVRGIRKITGVEEPKASAKETVIVNSAAGITPLLERAFIFLEDGDFSSADEYCERVLDQDPRNARAYLGKMMASFRVSREEDLANQRDSFENDPNYRKAARFADEALSAELTGYLNTIRARKEEERRADAYRRALEAESAAATEHSCLAAAELFDALRDYKDARDRAAACRERAETIRKNGVYDKALAEIRAGRFEKAIEIFESISGWRDSEEKIEYCRREIENEKIRAEQARLEAERKAEQARIAKEKRRAQLRRSMRIVIPVLLAAIAITVGAMVIRWRQGKINEAMAYVAAEDYETGYAKLEKLGLHKRVVQNMKDRAAALIAAEDYEAAYALLEEAGDHEAVLANKHERAQKLISAEDYEAGYALLEEAGANEAVLANKHERAQKLISAGDYEAGYTLLEEAGDHEAVLANKYERAVALIAAEDFETGYALLEELGKTEEIASSKYDRAVALIEKEEYNEAYALLDGLNYKDSAVILDGIDPKLLNPFPLSKAKVGSYIEFGSYEQDNDTSNGPEPIEWLVMFDPEGNLLLLSRNILDYQPIHSDDTEFTWNTCDLRIWLNKDFMNSAFTVEEQGMILPVSGGMISLLSETEAKHFFHTPKERICESTKYARAQMSSSRGSWWLRTEDDNAHHPPCVGQSGVIISVGLSSTDIRGIRPCLRIQLSPAEIETIKYETAVERLANGEYEAAWALLEELGKTEEVATLKYDAAVKLIQEGDYEAAWALLEELGKTEEIAASKYDRAVKLMQEGDYEAAWALLEELGKTEEIAASKYDRAVKLMQEGEYRKAYKILDGLDYKDSEVLLESIPEKLGIKKLTEAEVGDHVLFGSYEQDNDLTNGVEPIEWLVLDKKDGRILVISRYALDYRQYHNKWAGISWGNCTLREWLNDGFLNKAFSSNERSLIWNTTDKVFLLSTSEAREYFSSMNAWQCVATKYTMAKGGFTYPYCAWWLRSRGDSGSDAAYVNDDGRLVENNSSIGGCRVDINHGVRPALWINLES